jgi:chromosomal replication initiator protein
VETSPDQLWSQVLERLQLQLSRPTFETWIKTAIAEQLENDCLVIRTPNPFAKNWLQKYYIKTIADVVQDILGQRVEIHLTVAAGDDDPNTDADASWALPITPNTSESPSNRQPRPPELNLKYVFSRFVVGSNNRMAHAASLAVAESPGREFNPYSCVVALVWGKRI